MGNVRQAISILVVPLPMALVLDYLITNRSHSKEPRVTMKLLTVSQSQLNTLVVQGVHECSVSKQLHHEMCVHISNIVIKANQGGAVPLFSSRFETEEISSG